MNRITLYGPLAETYGSTFDLDVRTPGEAIHAILCQCEGMREIVATQNWKIIRGPLATGCTIGVEELGLGLGKDELHWMPAVEGEGEDGGPIKVVVGAVLTVVGAYFGQGWLVQAGLGMLFSGAAMMLAPPPETNDPNDAGLRKQSFVFSGPVNVSEQGHPVPIVYGEVRVGSVVVSSGVSTEKVIVTVPRDDEDGQVWSPIDILDGGIPSGGG